MSSSYSWAASRSQSRRWREASDFRGGFSPGKPANDNTRIPTPANDNQPQKPSSRILRTAKFGFKTAANFSPVGRAWRLWRTFQSFNNLTRWSPEEPAGYFVPAGWVQCTRYSACTVVPDGHYWMSAGNTYCNSGSTACLTAQAANGAQQGTSGLSMPGSFSGLTLVRKTNTAAWGSSAARYTFTRLFRRVSASVSDPVPEYRPQKDGVVFPRVWPDFNPMSDPMSLPIGQPSPEPQPIPYRQLPRRAPNPYRSPTEQSHWGHSRRPQNRGEIIFSSHPRLSERQALHKRTRPTRDVRESKVRARNWRTVQFVRWLVGQATEALDITELLWNSLDKKERTKWLARNFEDWNRVRPQDKVRAIWDLWDTIDPYQFLHDFAVMQLTDMAFGQLGQWSGQAAALNDMLFGFQAGPWDTLNMEPEIQDAMKDWLKAYSEREALLTGEVN